MANKATHTLPFEADAASLPVGRLKVVVVEGPGKGPEVETDGGLR